MKINFYFKILNSYNYLYFLKNINNKNSIKLGDIILGIVKIKKYIINYSIIIKLKKYSNYKNILIIKYNYNKVILLNNKLNNFLSLNLKNYILIFKKYIYLKLFNL